jgi:endonuclease YncB( thermonuclease family)
MKKTIAAVIAALGIGFGAGYLVGNCNSNATRKNPKPLTESKTQSSGIEKKSENTYSEKLANTYSIKTYVDGDTVDVEPGIVVIINRTRLLGINTPEKHEYFYKEATSALEQMISGKQIILEKEPKKELDPHDRLLRYIIVDGKNVNIEMVRQGYAKAFMTEGLKYRKEILEAEKYAKDNKLGIWANR